MDIAYKEGNLMSGGADNYKAGQGVISQLPTKTGTKYDAGKNRLELIPSTAIDALGRAFTFGAKKYNSHNWANGFEWDRLVGALLRHINSWRSGEDIDPESGLSHLDHVLACAAMLSAHEQEGLGNDNRRKIVRKMQKD